MITSMLSNGDFCETFHFAANWSVKKHKLQNRLTKLKNCENSLERDLRDRGEGGRSRIFFF